uniref:Uncharacterized protein n=1 Tax=Arundo donax TaxID=35708 RepID=A0A0A9BW00_ARUDO
MCLVECVRSPSPFVDACLEEHMCTVAKLLDMVPLLERAQAHSAQPHTTGVSSRRTESGCGRRTIRRGARP